MNRVISSNPPVTLPVYLTATSIGKKILMATTGFITFGFVLGHMVGNLQIFLGPERMNSYAETLQQMGPILWVVRLVLAGCFIIHIWLGIQLKLENWTARPVGYRNESTVQASFASRTMIWTGLTVLVFVIYHLLHFTVRATNPEFVGLTDPMGRFDVYSMVIAGFSNYLVSVVYIVAVALLSYHLSHSVMSMFQTFGLNNPKWQTRLDRIAWFFTIVLFLGYASIPTAVMLDCVGPMEGGV